MTAPRRILIVRLSAIGDVIVTTPVSRALRHAFPAAYLAWVVEPRAADVIRDNPFLDEVIPWERKKGGLRFRELLEITRKLRERKFDTVIDCQGLLRSAVLGRLCGARCLIGNVPAREQAHRLYTIRVARSQTDLSSRQRCLDLLRPLGIESTDRRMVAPVTDAARAEAKALLAKSGLDGGEPYTCLVPATTWPQKHWIEERWGELAARLADETRSRPVLLGGPADAALARRVCVYSGERCLDLTGRTSLTTAGAVLAAARCTVAVDTGLMHLSVAAGTPTVGLCGASWFRGFQDYERFALVREDLPCSPCLHHPTCDGRFDCMRALSVDRVLHAAAALLEEHGGG